jgi:hypothetical protein
MPLVWLTDVKPDESIAWLASLVTGSPDAGDRHDRVAKTAMSAIALHDVPSADRALEGFVAASSPEWLRGDTAFWLGNSRGEPGARLLARMIAQDPSDKVRDKVAFGLSVSKVPAALTTLIATAREDKSARVRWWRCSGWRRPVARKRRGDQQCDRQRPEIEKKKAASRSASCRKTRPC